MTTIPPYRSGYLQPRASLAEWNLRAVLWTDVTRPRFPSRPTSWVLALLQPDRRRGGKGASLHEHDFVMRKTRQSRPTQEPK
ncbi:hypothetical protein J4Q44_G00264690 [Coregonus suidteri]|uniref:Uncharacterized protein n=1 Tax=Coregonus suidteri TaxID=861788 RepID=A0AAN8LDA9_9TELE